MGSEFLQQLGEDHASDTVRFIDIGRYRWAPESMYVMKGQMRKESTLSTTALLQSQPNTVTEELREKLQRSSEWGFKSPSSRFTSH